MPKDRFNPVNLLAIFFSQLHIIQRFNVFKDEQITGWENWLQIELAYFLHYYVTNQDGQWWREFDITWAEMPKDMERCKPDFWLWSGEEGSYYLLELKQTSLSTNNATNGILKDIKKLNALTKKFYAAESINGKKEAIKYTCKGKYFALVSKWEPNVEEAPKGVVEACSGSIGISGYHFVVYRSVCDSSHILLNTAELEQ